MKRAVVLILCVLFGMYVFFAGHLYAGMRKRTNTNGMTICIKDSTEHSYVTAAEIRQLLLVHQKAWQHIPVDSLDLAGIEQTALLHPWVRQAECCVSPSGGVSLQLYQRVPIIRILNGEASFYIDEDGQVMRMNRRLAIKMPVVTGAVSSRDSSQVSRLYEMARLIQADAYWTDFVGQIVVENSGKWLLIPANHKLEILLGKPENLAYKMKVIRTFYEKALPKVGYDRYRRIDLSFDGQIVCTKNKTI